MAVVTETNIPKRLRDLFEKGVIAMERDNFEYAITMFMTVLEVEPQFFKARQFLRAASIKQFHKAGGGKSTHIRSTIIGSFGLLSGFLALKRKNSMKALQTAENLLRKDPLNLYFIKLLCKSAEAAEMPEVAIHTLKIARDYYTQNTELIIWLGNLYTANNQLDEAKECFEAVVNLRPHDATAIKALKDAMARRSMTRDGWTKVTQEGASYRKLIKDEKETAVLEQQAKTIQAGENVDVLIQDSLDKLKEKPDDMNIHRSLANLYVLAKRFNKAISTLEEARRITGSADPALDRTISEIKVAKFDFQIEQCKKKGDMQATATKEAEKDDFIFKDVESRVKRYPNDLPLRYEYGVLLYKNNKLNEAIQQFQIAYRNPQRRIESIYRLAMCFKKKEQFDLAREQFEKAAAELKEMTNLKKDIYYQLGELHEANGNLDEAIKYFKEIYQVDISYKDVATKIESAYKHK